MGSCLGQPGFQALGLAFAAPVLARLAFRPAAGLPGRRPWAGRPGLRRCRQGGLACPVGAHFRGQEACRTWRQKNGIKWLESKAAVGSGPRERIDLYSRSSIIFKVESGV
jgi:hypothetical protein